MTMGKFSNNSITTWDDALGTCQSLIASDLNTTVGGSQVPIGAILNWLKSFTGTPSIPAGFKECDGTAVSDANSPLNGQTVPNLNGGNRFTRGTSGTTGTTGGAATHTHTDTFASSSNNGSSFHRSDISGTRTTTSASSLPPYYQVVKIIRIK